MALDGTKIRANASKHKAMSSGRMQGEGERLEAEVRGWLEQAEAADAAEDAELGPDRRGDELPAWVADKQERARRIREAKATLETEAKQRDQEALERERKRSGSSGGRPRKKPLGVPEPQQQYNFTDPESRIMKTPDGFQQCYNAQVAVDAASQVIVAHGLTQSGTDRGQLVPLLDAVQAHTGRTPREVSADSDYCAEDNLAALERRTIRGYIAVGKQQHRQGAPLAGRPAPPGTLRHRMKRRLQRGGWRSRYRLRKQTAEPVFGQAKHARGFRQFLPRGFAKVSCEWGLVCLASNLLKLHAAQV